MPAEVVAALSREGAQIAKVAGVPADPYGTFWRFFVANDPGVDRYILRDADSGGEHARVRGRAGVALASDRHFHVMRDSFDHAELVLAGMWGGVGGALPAILPWAQRFMASRTDIIGRTADQEFLRDQLWPTIRSSMMTHDSSFAFGEHRDFPAVGALPPGAHIGCDGRAMLNLR